MHANTAVNTSVTPVIAGPRIPSEVEESLRWKKRYVFSCLRDRRSLAEIGGWNAYLTQVRWSVWWALRA